MHSIRCASSDSVNHDKASGLLSSKRSLKGSASDLKSRKRSATETLIKIVSATYGPSEGQRLLTGELSNNDTSSIPFTRDVAPFLKALLVLGTSHDFDSRNSACDTQVSNDDEDSDLVRITGRKRNMIPLMGGRKMNTIFGDPCPGISKRLKIHYVTYDSYDQDGSARASSASEVHRVAFAEHDHVILRPRITYYQDDCNLRRAVAASVADTIIEQSNDDVHSLDESTLLNARTLGRTQSIAEFAETFSAIDLTVKNQNVQILAHVPPEMGRPWRLRSATSEIALPIVLPFLSVREKVHCILVCRMWRNLIQYLGVARSIDINDDTNFPNFTLPILRGLLAHSHHSLQSLFLSGFEELSKGDLHPSIPYLRKLECLDISRCNDLDDSTLILLSEHVSSTLEVFYLKGLRNVTDLGMMAIAQSCLKLQVLEISNVPITDVGGIGIGTNLNNLIALFMRDNYLLTNESVDLITERCTKLSQLTLWGCIRLTHLSFFASPSLSIGCGRLVILNLWGCHSLTDESANALRAMKYLRSLIVSECHKLTNLFLFRLAEFLPQLNHLHLRYCKMITDAGVDAIANSMQRLYSLDLSFCSRISVVAIVNLLESRQDTLTELRMQNCSQLAISNEHPNPIETSIDTLAHAGRAIFHSLRSLDSHSHLSAIDLRNCGGHANGSEGYSSDDPFTKGLFALRFKQVVAGFFRRPTRPSLLYQHLLHDVKIRQHWAHGEIFHGNGVMN